MKTIILTVAMLPGLALAYHDDVDDLTNQVNPMEMGRPLPPPEPIGSTYERIDRQFRGPAVVMPIEPSPTGSTYIDDTSIRTPKMDCYHSVTGAWVCQGH